MLCFMVTCSSSAPLILWLRAQARNQKRVNCLFAGKIPHILSGMRTLMISRWYTLPSTLNPPFAMRRLHRGTATLMYCVRLRTSPSSRGWSTHGVVLHANVLCVKVDLCSVLVFSLYLCSSEVRAVCFMFSL